MSSKTPRRQSSEAGTSLIELLVALGLVLIVLTGTFRAFDNARKASEVGGMLADGSQNLRMAVTFITRDAIQTGREMPTGGIPIPRGNGIAQIRRPGPPGVTLTFPATWTTLPSICPGNGLGPTVSGVATDIVTVFYADPTLALNEYPLSSILSDGSRMTVDSHTNIANAATGLAPGDLIMFTNALGNAIQTVTSISGQNVSFAAGNANDVFGFNQRSATSGSIMQIRSGSTFPTTSATRVAMVTYNIDATTAPGQVRLMRTEAFLTPRLVAMGIDNLQLTYDIVDGTTNPANQADAVAPYSPSQIRKINLFVSRRSEETFSQTRRRMRSSIATQVSLRSMSFMDRYR